MGFLPGVTGPPVVSLVALMDTKLEPEPVPTHPPKGRERTVLATWSRQGNAITDLVVSFLGDHRLRYCLHQLKIEILLISNQTNINADLG